MTNEVQKTVAHTPGPWTVDGVDWHVADDGGHRLELVTGENFTIAQVFVDEDDAEMRANARLIAEAPAMLAELRMMAALVESTFPAQAETWLDNARAIFRRIEG